MVTPTSDEILRTALEKETQAHDFYAVLAASCTIDYVKELLLKLQNEEYKHIRMIRDMLGRLESGKTLF